jgi:hypothetical protein
MRKGLSGYATLTDPLYNSPQEWDTFTCGHCWPPTIHRVQAGCDPADLGGLCKVCMRLICPKCLGGGCTPFEKKLEAEEASYNARRWMEQG